MILKGLGVGACVVVSMILFKQNQMLYIPQVDPRKSRHNRSNPRMYRSPAEWSMPYEEAFIETSDGLKVHGWFIKAGAQTKDTYTLLYFHGNAGNIGMRLPLLQQLREHADYNILALDYRGYGDSDAGSGGPTEKGIKLDARAAYDYLRERKDVANDRIIIFGRSLGGAVAISLAASLQENEQAAGLIVENTFTSIVDIALVLMPFLRLLRPVIKPPILINEWNSLGSIPRVQCPTLFISGLKDELIPPSHMKRLHEASSQRSGVTTTFRTIADGTHNDTPIRGGAQYYSIITEFVDQLQSEKDDGSCQSE